MEVRNLRAYLANIHMTVKEFAKIVDCPPAYLSAVANGKLNPGRRLVMDIYRATEGVVWLERRPTKRDLKKQQQQQQKEQKCAGI